MTEVTGDLFTWLPPGSTNVMRVITTNGTVKKNGEAVMGRGCALQAKTKWPALPRLLGTALSNNGLATHMLYTGNGSYSRYEPPKPTGTDIYIICFPVKYHWNEPADLTLIAKSTRELVLARYNWTGNIPSANGCVIIPRPGCGNGRLTWEQVKPVMEAALIEGMANAAKLGYRRMPPGQEWLYVISPP